MTMIAASLRLVRLERSVTVNVKLHAKAPVMVVASMVAKLPPMVISGRTPGIVFAATPGHSSSHEYLAREAKDSFDWVKPVVNKFYQ